MHRTFLWSIMQIREKLWSTELTKMKKMLSLCSDEAVLTCRHCGKLEDKRQALTIARQVLHNQMRRPSKKNLFLKKLVKKSPNSHSILFKNQNILIKAWLVKRSKAIKLMKELSLTETTSARTMRRASLSSWNQLKKQSQRKFLFWQNQ